MGTHLKVLSESFPMNTKMTGFDDFQKSLRPCALDKCYSLSIGRVKDLHLTSPVIIYKVFPLRGIAGNQYKPM